MGGCRCSYRTCTSRSDGKTHMFHYPVFDKVRCHQWLTNAHKLEFLNLKVSQLKNRVVCQHHFRDDNFMNFKKDKLTFEAVPTEDGPYCDSSQIIEIPTEQEVGKEYTIVLEDIENEYLTLNDKKANFSVKYGDFLTNCDIMDLNNLNHIDNTLIDSKEKVILEPNTIILNDNIDRNLQANNELVKTKSVAIRKLDKQIMEDKTKTKSVTPSVTNMEFDEVFKSQQNKKESTNQKAVIKIDCNVNSQKDITTKSAQKEKKIKIISEQKVSEPVPLQGKFEPLSPTRVLPFPKKQRNIVADSNNTNKTMIEISIDNLIENNVQEVSNKPQEREKQKSPSPKITRSLIKKNNDELLNRTLVTKYNRVPSNIISPERVAVIEEKRKFNMKLRDIIETCLDKLDDQERVDENTKYVPKLKKEQIVKDPVGSYLETEPKLAHLSTEPKLSKLSTAPKLRHINQYTITYLEDRMKKMEDNLINKINQNSLRIMDLKKTFSASNIEKKTVHTQTAVHEELHKKHLFQEISKYLSPDANNLIYEELFINKYVQNVPKSEPLAKRRRCR